jgi:hypothetical protein
MVRPGRHSTADMRPMRVEDVRIPDRPPARGGEHPVSSGACEFYRGIGATKAVSVIAWNGAGCAYLRREMLVDQGATTLLILRLAVTLVGLRFGDNHARFLRTGTAASVARRPSEDSWT